MASLLFKLKRYKLVPKAEVPFDLSWESGQGAELTDCFSPSGVVNMEEANKLIGTGKKHLVMGKVVEAVSTLQEASGMLWVTLKSRWSFSEVEREMVP